MSDERKQILRMLAEGKINANEADLLLEALERRQRTAQSDPSGDSAAHPAPTCEQVRTGRKPSFLHVQVRSKAGAVKNENVDIRVPLLLLKAGVKIGSMIPEKTRGKLTGHLADKGIDIDLNKLDARSLEDLIQGLSECSIDVDSEDETVRIYCD